MRRRGFAPIDAGVVNDRIHAPERVDLICDILGLGGTSEITEPLSRQNAPRVGDGRSAARRPSVQHHPMAVIEKGLRRRAAEPVRAANNEDARHNTPFDILERQRF